MPISVAIVGSGPSGFYVADSLLKSEADVEIDIIDRLPTPFGLIRGGVAPDRRAIEGADDAHVVDAWQVMNGEANVGQSVVVADWRCDWVGLGLAEKLVRDGCPVRLAVNGTMPGQSLQQHVRDHWVGELHKLGVEIIPYARVFGIDADTVYLQHSASGEPMLVEGVDTLVLAQGSESEDGLLAELEGYAGIVRPIGDCLAPRTAEEAVFDGLREAWRL